VKSELPGPICGSVAGCCEHVQVFKMQENFSLGENLLASLEGLCFVESFVWLLLEGLVAHAAD